MHFSPPAISSRPARIRFDQEYAIPDTLATFGIGQLYTLVRNDTLYTLFFTTFPILAVQTLDGTLPGDNDTPATMTLSDGQAISINSPIDINIRGGVPRTFPKKSYKIEFVNNTASRESRDTSLPNLRNDSD